MYVDDLHVHVTVESNTQLDRIEQLLIRLLRANRNLTEGVYEMAADLSGITREVQENNDVVQSAVQLLSNLAAQIRDLEADPAAIQALADQLDSNSSMLANAVAANTPAQPEVPTNPPGMPGDENPHPDNTLPGDLPPDQNPSEGRF